MSTERVEKLIDGFWNSDKFPDPILTQPERYRERVKKEKDTKPKPSKVPQIDGYPSFSDLAPDNLLT